MFCVANRPLTPNICSCLGREYGTCGICLIPYQVWTTILEISSHVLVHGGPCHLTGGVERYRATWRRGRSWLNVTGCLNGYQGDGRQVIRIRHQVLNGLAQHDVPQALDSISGGEWTLCKRCPNEWTSFTAGDFVAKSQVPLSKNHLEGMAESSRSSTTEQDFGDTISMMLEEGEAFSASRVGGSGCWFTPDK